MVCKKKKLDITEVIGYGLYYKWVAIGAARKMKGDDMKKDTTKKAPKAPKAPKATQATVQNRMTARQAAEMVNEKDKSLDDVKKVIPDYPNALHRNQWIATFLKGINTQALRDKFSAGLKPPKKAKKDEPPTTA